MRIAANDRDARAAEGTALDAFEQSERDDLPAPARTGTVGRCALSAPRCGHWGNVRPYLQEPGGKRYRATVDEWRQESFPGPYEAAAHWTSRGGFSMHVIFSRAKLEQIVDASDRELRLSRPRTSYSQETIEEHTRRFLEHASASGIRATDGSVTAGMRKTLPGADREAIR